MSLAVLVLTSTIGGTALATSPDAESTPQAFALPLPEIPPFAMPPAAAPMESQPKAFAEQPRDEFLVVRGVEIPGFAMPSEIVAAEPVKEAASEPSKSAALAVPAPESAGTVLRVEIETPPIPALNLSMLQVDPPAILAPSVAQPSVVALDLDAERAQAILEPLRAKLKIRAAVVEQIAAFYAARAWQPLWIDAEGKLAPKAQGALEAIAKAGDEGLDSARLLAVLPVSLGEASGRASLSAERRNEAELALSLAASTYAQDARGGRLEPNRLSSMLTPALSLPQAGDVLEALAKAEAAGDVRKALLAFNPPHAGYRALRDALAKLRAEPKGDPDITASTGPNPAALRASLPPNFMNGAGLNPGQEDARVPLMRVRLGLPATEGITYDAALAEAVREFQRANNLKPDGRVTPRTRTLLEDLEAPLTRIHKAKAAPDDRIATIIANMERWRWLPPELGRTHIFVNIPDFRLEMMDEGARIFETRVIVGKPERQTPIFSDQMEFLVVNPSWFIPPTILRKDVLPKLAADPGYAARMGYEVTRRGNSISVRQPPGNRNALGHVKFMFPNEHAVYLHDTPGRHLFRADTRAFSSGCVRVEGPFQLAEHLLLKSQGLNERQLRAMVGSSERTIRLNEKVPVHLAYFTYQVDANGVLVRKPDLYGHDARIRRALSL
ncbi:MAG: L,D-transpeptidase family protein [Rhizobiales bacterium]|nr:L,D-transpeptidase family protein [Hyphomicrobiales bacterium]